jgi:hypothetical protein
MSGSACKPRLALIKCLQGNCRKIKHRISSTAVIPWKGNNKAPSAVQKRLEIVGVAGFEPTTSCSQSRRDTGLRYTPNWYRSFVLRRKRDSNPRYRCQYDSLANCSFRPLRHPSILEISLSRLQI